MQEADGRTLSEKEAMRFREERINGTDPAGPSPVTPVSDRSPSSTVATSTLPSSLSSRVRNPISRGEVIELSPLENRTMQLVSPLDGSDGSRTMGFTNLSPLSPVADSPDTARKRFSYEDP